MAKKSKTESVLSRETRLQAEADAISGAKSAAEHTAAEKERAAMPAAKAVRPKKAKKARFVREQTEKKPESKAAPFAERSTTAGGKMMTKNVSYRPKKEPRTGR